MLHQVPDSPSPPGTPEEGPRIEDDANVRGGGGLATLEARVAYLEGEHAHLATKEDTANLRADIANLRADLADREARLMRWVVGLVVGLFVAQVGALVAGLRFLG